MDPSRLNPEGGAIALGHPVGASGARLVLHLLRSLQRKGGGLGVATFCASAAARAGGDVVESRIRVRDEYRRTYALIGIGESEIADTQALLTLDVAGQSANTRVA